jgi:YHS domain-containing protein
MSPDRRTTSLSLALLACAGLATAAIADAVLPAEADQTAGQIAEVMPRYDTSRSLELPHDYRQWILVGSSLGLSYSEAGGGHEMFHHTLMEPTAYRHFVRTREFREGTMFVLLLHGTGEGVLPSRRGQFASNVHGVEMAVKDKARTPEGWAYYNFGGMDGLRSAVQPMRKESCYNCHVQHAARDNVFLQFYPMLAEAAGITLPSAVAAAASPAPVPERSPSAAQQPAQTAPATTPAIAIRGLDPVQLVEGREEMGKPEIVADHGGYRYQFVSEPSRVKFAADPARYAIQNTSCLVVPGAAIDPALFAVHQTRIYAFATPDCVAQFKAKPDAYVTKD